MPRRFRIRDFVPREAAFHFARVELGEADAAHLHDHDFPELFWIEAGRAAHWIRGRKRPLEPGALVFVLPRDFHTVGAPAPEGRTVLCNLAFPPAAWEAARKGPLRRQPSWFRPGPPERRERRVSARTLDFLRQAGAEFAASDRSELMLHRFFLNLAVALREEEEALSGPGGAAPAWLQDAVARVEREELFRTGPSALTRAAGRSQEHVVREVRRWLGKTPTELVNAMRMRHAARLLSGTRREIVDVCGDCGLDNLSHFYALFRRSHGMTPRRYRLHSQRIVGRRAG